MIDNISKKQFKNGLKDYLISTKNVKNKLLANTTDYPMNAKTLEKLASGVLKEYQNQNFLQHYIVPLNQFIDNYKYSKFASFLANLSCFTFLEKSKLELQMPAEVKCFVEKRSTCSLVTRATILSNISPRPLSRLKRSMSPQSIIRLSGNPIGLTTATEPFPNGLVDFIKQEIMRKDNFFFELAYFIGEIYTQRYANDLKAFDLLLKEIRDKGLPTNFIFDNEEKNRIKKVYEEALEDMKEFQEFLYNLLKVFITQLSRRIDNTDSRVPPSKMINNIATNLLFGRNKCYQTIFSLIRYSTIQHELALKETCMRFKGFKPADFGLDRAFCNEKERVPYEEVIDALDYMDVYTSPDEKFKFILMIRRQILKFLGRYRIKEGLDDKKLAMTGDQLLPLYTYCLAANGNEKLRAHQIFIENFVENKRLFLDEEGYCFSTFVGAVDSLTGIKSPRISLDNLGR